MTDIATIYSPFNKIIYYFAGVADWIQLKFSIKLILISPAVTRCRPAGSSMTGLAPCTSWFLPAAFGTTSSRWGWNILARMCHWGLELRGEIEINQRPASICVTGQKESETRMHEGLNMQNAKFIMQVTVADVYHKCEKRNSQHLANRLRASEMSRSYLCNCFRSKTWLKIFRL